MKALYGWYRNPETREKVEYKGGKYPEFISRCETQGEIDALFLLRQPELGRLFFVPAGVYRNPSTGQAHRYMGKRMPGWFDEALKAAETYGDLAAFILPDSVENGTPIPEMEAFVTHKSVDIPLFRRTIEGRREKHNK